jgi:hypothetical protein
VCPDCQGRAVTLLGANSAFLANAFCILIKLECIIEQKEFIVRLLGNVGHTVLEYEL